MKVKYLKDMHNAKAGDVLELNSLQARVLILRGIVEPVEETSAKKKKTKSDE